VDAVPSRAAVTRRQPTGADLVAVPGILAELAAARSGVLTRAELAQVGFSEGRIRAAVDAERWRPFGRNVVVLDNAPLSDRQRRWVAVLLPDKPAALAGLSGAASAGLQGLDCEQVHILVAHDTQTRVPGWVKLHESRRFSEADVVTVGGPPRTTASRSVIDAATWSTRPRRACAILCAAVQQRVTTSGRLLTELQRAGHIRHVAIMRDILGDIDGGGQTLAEIELGPLAIRAGLGPPRRQVLRREAGGKVRYVDAEFDLPDGTVLAVEIDGAVHLQPMSWWDDTKRQNELVIGGQPVLRYPSLTVRLHKPEVVDQLRRIRIAHTPR
jgi:hypothetical protein